MPSWSLVAVALVGALATALVVLRRREADLLRRWEMILTPSGRQAIASLELRALSDAAMAEHAYHHATLARHAHDFGEATRLLGLAYRVVEDATPDRLRRLRGLAACIRMASAVAPVPALRPKDFHLRPIIAAMGLGAALHYLVVTSMERFLLRVRFLSMGFRIALHALAGATWDAYHAPAASPAWDVFSKALADWKSLDRAHVDCFRALIESLSVEPERG